MRTLNGNMLAAGFARLPDEHASRDADAACAFGGNSVERQCARPNAQVVRLPFDADASVAEKSVVTVKVAGKCAGGCSGHGVVVGWLSRLR